VIGHGDGTVLFSTRRREPAAAFAAGRAEQQEGGFDKLRIKPSADFD
jgi:hypothetical protein